MSQERLHAELPDIPVWIYARALLAANDAIVAEVGERSAFLVSSARYSLGVLVGVPDRGLLQRAIEGATGPPRFLSQTEASAAAAAALPDWRSTPAIVHTLGSDGLLVPDVRAPVETLLLREAQALEDWPPELRQELARGAQDAPAAIALVASTPASICHVAFETESLWDVSVETLEPYRRRGLAESCAVHLIQEMHRRGKMPVWGAEAQNVASLRLAWKLGFIPADRLVLFSRP